MEIDVMQLLGQIFIPLLAILGSAFGVYMKVQRDAVSWRKTIEHKIEGALNDLGRLILANTELVREVKALVTTQATLDKMVESHHSRLNSYSDRLKEIEREFAIFKAICSKCVPK